MTSQAVVPAQLTVRVICDQDHILSGLFIVFNDTAAFTGVFDDLRPLNRSFIIKYSHLFDVLH